MKQERVPMREPFSFAKDVVAASVTRTPKVGVRFSLDVAEEALMSMGREAMPYIAKELATVAIHRNATVIDAAVHEKLYNDRAWLDKIIEEETRRITREFISATLQGWIERMETNAAVLQDMARRFGMEERSDD